MFKRNTHKKLQLAKHIYMKIMVNQVNDGYMQIELDLAGSMAKSY